MALGQVQRNRKLTKLQLRQELHNLNPYAGYMSSYGERLTIVQLRQILARYGILQRHDYKNLPKR